jgi:hypothetical protein
LDLHRHRQLKNGEATGFKLPGLILIRRLEGSIPAYGDTESVVRGANAFFQKSGSCRPTAGRL